MTDGTEGAGPMTQATQGATEATEGIFTDTPAAANDLAPPDVQLSNEQLAALSPGATMDAQSSIVTPGGGGTFETKVYSDGTVATGLGPLPDLSPAQQDAAQAAALLELDKMTAPAALTAITEPSYLIGSSVQPATQVIGDVTYTLGDIVVCAKADSGLSGDEWNALPEGERDVLIAKEVESLRAEALHAKATEAMFMKPPLADRPSGLHNTVREVEVARKLPFLVGAGFEPVTHEGCVERFMDESAEGERRVARIVADADGILCKEILTEGEES